MIFAAKRRFGGAGGSVVDYVIWSQGLIVKRRSNQSRTLCLVFDPQCRSEGSLRQSVCSPDQKVHF
jgi:hypothetical protein